MARAKRTDRAEARRRFRAAQVVEGAEPSDTDEEDDAASPAPQAPAAARVVRSGRPGKPPSPLDMPPIQVRPGLFGAVVSAVRPVDIRGDIRLLVPLVTQTKAVAIPTLLVAVASILMFIPSIRVPLSFAITLFIIYPPMAGPFLAGILAPRAGWLAGLINGLVAGLGSAIVIFGLTALPGGSTLTSSERISYLFNFLTVWPLFGAFVGAFAAFYKRFLKFSNPNAGRPPARRGGPSMRPTARPAAKRR